MVRFLQRCGYGVESAGNGTDALVKFESAEFDAMICDVRMPGLSGPELLPRVLAHDPNLAVLMLSAVNDAPHRRACAGRWRDRLPRQADRAAAPCRMR